MDFELSEEQELLRQGVRELLDRSCDIRHVRSVSYNGDAQDPELWRALADAGWTGVAVPADQGGAGLGFEELAVVAMEAGRAVLHLPLVTTLLAGWILSQAPGSASRDRALAEMARGDLSVTLALQGASEDRSGPPGGAEAVPTGSGWRLSGGLNGVPFGPLAGAVLLEASLPAGGRGLFLVPTGADGLGWTPLEAMDRTVRQYDLRLGEVTVEPGAALFGEGDAGAAADLLAHAWRAALAAETVGACERLVELSVAYAAERVQFGRPIGTNQAVKARIAEMAAAVERMRVAVYYAALQLHKGDDVVASVNMAKAAAAAPAAFVASQAIHVHGGIGFTWEHDAHIYFKRIKSNELLLGDGAASLARLATAVL